MIDLLAGQMVSGHIKIAPFIPTKPAIQTESASTTKEEEKIEPVLATVAEETHWIKYQFVDTGGNPVPIEYKFIDTQDNVEENQTSENGEIYKSGLIPGTCSVLLYQIISAEWIEHKITIRDEAQLFVKVKGFPDGTPATIESFRQFLENQDIVVTTLEQSISDGQINLIWRYEPNDQDISICRFVAKVIVGNSWVKTNKPLEVILPELRSARRSEEEIQVGQSVQMIVDVVGIEPGAEMIFKVYRECYDQEDSEVYETSEQVTGQEVLGHLSYFAELDDQAAVDSNSEYYFVAEFNNLISYSDLLLVENIERAGRSPEIEEGEAGEEDKDEPWKDSPFITDEENELEEGQEWQQEG